MMILREFTEKIAKQKVVGSNPIVRSIIFSNWHDAEKGAVPKWLRERSAKPRFVGSNPTRASIASY